MGLSPVTKDSSTTPSETVSTSVQRSKNDVSEFSASVALPSGQRSYLHGERTSVDHRLPTNHQTFCPVQISLFHEDNARLFEEVARATKASDYARLSALMSEDQCKEVFDRIQNTIPRSNGLIPLGDSTNWSSYINSWNPPTTSSSDVTASHLPNSSVDKHSVEKVALLPYEHKNDYANQPKRNTHANHPPVYSNVGLNVLKKGCSLFFKGLCDLITAPFSALAVIIWMPITEAKMSALSVESNYRIAEFIGRRPPYYLTRKCLAYVSGFCVGVFEGIAYGIVALITGVASGIKNLVIGALLIPPGLVLTPITTAYILVRRLVDRFSSAPST